MCGADITLCSQGIFDKLNLKKIYEQTTRASIKAIVN